MGDTFFYVGDFEFTWATPSFGGRHYVNEEIYFKIIYPWFISLVIRMILILSNISIVGCGFKEGRSCRPHIEILQF